MSHCFRVPCGPSCSPLDQRHGLKLELVNWISNSSEPSLIPPQYGGSTRSKLITMLEDDHYEVKLPGGEMDKLCVWIDLVVPFCGDYMEANAWNEGELDIARQRIELRKRMDEIERQSIEAMLDSVVASQ